MQRKEKKKTQLDEHTRKTVCLLPILFVIHHRVDALLQSFVIYFLFVLLKLHIQSLFFVFLSHYNKSIAFHFFDVSYR